MDLNTPDPFVSAETFTAPPESKINAPVIEEANAILQDESELPPPVPPEVAHEEPPKRGPGRPADTDEEKARKKREKEETARMGDLFDGPPEMPEPPKPGETSPSGEATKLPRKSGKRADLDALGEIIALNQYGIVGIIFDREEANPLAQRPDGSFLNPNGAVTHARVKAGWAEYLKASGSEGVSPGMGLLLVNGAYLVEVVSQPKSSEKMKTYIGKAIGWIRGKLGKDKKV